MPVFIPDENGELTALNATVAETVSQMPTPDLGASAVKMFVSLIVLVALLYLSYWFLRKMIHQKLQKGNGNGAIQILEKKMVSPKTMLYLVEVENKKVLLAESQLEIKRLESFPAERESYGEPHSDR